MEFERFIELLSVHVFGAISSALAHGWMALRNQSLFPSDRTINGSACETRHFLLDKASRQCIGQSTCSRWITPGKFNQIRGKEDVKLSSKAQKQNFVYHVLWQKDQLAKTYIFHRHMGTITLEIAPNVHKHWSLHANFQGKEININSPVSSSSVCINKTIQMQKDMRYSWEIWKGVTSMKKEAEIEKKHRHPKAYRAPSP